MMAQRQLKSTKFSGSNSGKSESIHPVFRDTIEYVDAAKYNIH